MEYGLIGMPLGHSFSQEIHESLGLYHYELLPLESQEFHAFMQKRAFRGINVTIPYKQEVIPYLDEIDPLAAEIGAVNCVVNRAGKLFGYNTDLAGMQALVTRLGLNLQGKKVLICGTGGTSKTARTMAHAAGAAQVIRLSRTAKTGAAYTDTITYAQAYNEHANAQIIVNTTPSGMFPHNGEWAINAAAFAQLEGIIDAVYNPLETALVQQGHTLDIPAEGGLYMLVAQAVYAAKYFAGEAFAQALTNNGETTATLCERIFNKLERKKRNMVLIGMPGCGKSTVGAFLAKKTGRTLIDTDQLVFEMSGKTPDQIITEDGEEAFRAVETQAIAQAGKETSSIIATGGGAILRPQNIAALKQNGLLYFIDRPPELLVPTQNRPLSSSPEKLAQLYHERLPRYTACADFIIPANCSALHVAQQIEERHSA